MGPPAFSFACALESLPYTVYRNNPSPTSSSLPYWAQFALACAVRRPTLSASVALSLSRFASPAAAALSLQSPVLQADPVGYRPNFTYSSAELMAPSAGRAMCSELPSHLSHILAHNLREDQCACLLSERYVLLLRVCFYRLAFRS